MENLGKLYNFFGLHIKRLFLISIEDFCHPFLEPFLNNILLFYILLIFYKINLVHERNLDAEFRNNS